MVNATAFGSCRINNSLPSGINLGKEVSYTHSTKETIQLLNFYLGKLTIQPPYSKYCFRTGIVENKFIDYNPKYKKTILNSDVVFIEICSKKKYIHGGYYLHHLSVDKRFPEQYRKTPKSIIQEFELQTQSEEEIELDIIELQRILYPRKIVIISHYDAKLSDGRSIESRLELINTLKRICEKHDIYLIQPADVFRNNSQNHVVTADLGHYTEKGKQIFSTYIKSFLKINT